MSEASTIETTEKLSLVELWGGEITAAEAELKKFYERGAKVNRKFLDEREAMNADNHWFNIFYANTNILESALYAQLPKPTVSRKFTDYNDDVGRVASLILERVITQDMDDPTDTFDSTMRHCVQDRLVPGLSQAWLRLETDTSEISVPPMPGADLEMVGSEGQPELPGMEGQSVPPQQITDQRVCIDYIYWRDFLWSPCRVWEERRWVGRRAYMTRDELIERFGEDLGKKCPLDYSPKKSSENAQSNTPVEDIVKKAVVYEIWDRTTRKVYWYNKGMTEMLDTKDDPLGLRGFEPCPRPMLANLSTSNTVPRPDYYMLQDQYMELDTINNRISLLIQACKVVGVYDKSSTGLARMLQEGFDNQLIPVDNWAMFAEKGGIKGQLDWLPLEAVTQALQQLNAAREVIKGQIYELTGIADIVRGASKASETLGAQQIKAQFASVRIKKLQDEVARFATDIMRIKSEILVKHFDPSILVKRSGIMYTGNDQYVAPALQLLTSADEFEWRINISADTLAQADYAMEKKDRIEFMTSVSKFMASAGPMLERAPETAPILVNLLKWTVSAFRNAKDIEGQLDKALDEMTRKPAQPKPNPAQQQQQAEQQKMQAEMQMRQQENQQKMQLEQQKFQMEAQKAQMEMQAEQQRNAMELQAEQARLSLEQQRLQMEMMFEKLMAELKLRSAQDLAEAKLESTYEAKVLSRTSGSDSSL